MADFWPCLVECTKEQHAEGRHLDIAENTVQDYLYGRPFACDDKDPLFHAINTAIKSWKGVPCLKV